MGQHLFDELARGAATRMPRRRMLKLLGATAATSMLPGILRPGRARGATDCASYEPQACYQLCCNETDLCCPTSDGVGACCPAGSESVTINGTALTGKTVCKQVPDGNPCHTVWTCGAGTTPCGGEPDSPATCCRRGQRCRSGLCVDACPGGREQCGSRCCPSGQTCEDGRCVRPCRHGRVRCGRGCCPKGKRCVDGKCRRCPGRKEPCGSTCCPHGEECITDYGDSMCCDTRRHAVCGTGPAGRRKLTCCPPKTHCALVIAPGDAGVRIDSDMACCPPERFVPGPDVCCSPGWTSMGGRLTAQYGLCCPQAQACRGADGQMNCCAEGAVCRDGVCVAA